ncbi:2-phospho-L-lactate guanylyltransferase [Natronomonas gomsonensis]|jgi:2-phospho-L-lactate guanylyltransferase|uniref:2-phospho-L-lactate guanylyltransferase n=1 Tax=Natronomonas gomsonensis TaxID=1046043 RepID=UPI0020CA7350|nr:2-phospho-L-lactate guanylyltransferase [Natronomonas gomsonensis]MCY4732517.1 2-phospho-L-lactate guanylyltransferase [Natronomonas gomsonensis]
MNVYVPFAAREPKTRLADAFEPDERATFARALLLDVCDAISRTGREPTVLATDSVDCPYPVVVDDRLLTDAVNARLDSPVAVVMADLGLANAVALERLFEADGDVVIAPGLGGGTNALVVRHPDFEVDYHGASVRDHRRIARGIGTEATMVDSFRLAVDIDEPRDLVELLLHGEGRAREWLEDAGFAVQRRDGRVGIGRDA